MGFVSDIVRFNRGNKLGMVILSLTGQNAEKNKKGHITSFRY